MAAPSFRSKGAYGVGTTSCVAAVPTGGDAPQSGDVLLIVLESSDSTTLAGTPNTPANWTKIFEETQGAGATGVTTLTVFYKRAGASESDVTIDGVGNHCSATMLVYKDCLSSEPPYVVGTGNGAASGNGTMLGVSTPVDECLVVCINDSSGDSNSTTTFSAWTNGNLTSLTEREDNRTNTGAGGGFGVADGVKASAGATGDTTVTISTSVPWRSVHVVLKPNPSSSISGAGNIATAEAHGASALAPVASPTGIASAGAFGTGAIIWGSIQGAGAIASAEALGASAVGPVISGAGNISGAESFGNATVQEVVVISGAGNIGSAESIGQPSVAQNISATGISSAEAEGQPSISVSVSASGISTSEAVGNPSVGPAIAPSAIASAEAIGQPSASVSVAAVAISGAEAFGTTVVTEQGQDNISGAGNISSSQAFGSPSLNVTIASQSIASGEALGGSSISLAVAGQGIASGEALGNPSMSAAISPQGIASAETFGGASISQNISAQSIASAGAFGNATITGLPPGDNIIGAGGIVTGELFGSPSLGYAILPAGIASSLAFGVAVIGGGLIIQAGTIIIREGLAYSVITIDFVPSYSVIATDFVPGKVTTQDERIS